MQWQQERQRGNKLVKQNNFIHRACFWLHLLAVLAWPWKEIFLPHLATCQLHRWHESVGTTAKIRKREKFVVVCLTTRKFTYIWPFMWGKKKKCDKVSKNLLQFISMVTFSWPSPSMLQIKLHAPNCYLLTLFHTNCSCRSDNYVNHCVIIIFQPLCNLVFPTYCYSLNSSSVPSQFCS